MRMIMGEKNSRKSRKMAKILAITLAMIMVFNPGMLTYAEEGDGTDSEAKNVISMQNEQATLEKDETPDDGSTIDSESGNKAREQDTEKEFRNESDNSVENIGDDAAEKNKVPEKKDVRKALQNAKSPELDAETDEEDEGSEETITVTVRIVNETFPKSEGAPWEGTLIEKKIVVPSNYTMMQALHKVCRDNNIESRGTDGSYVSMIGGLKEFSGGSGGGWMGTLNDWFVNQGFSSIEIKDGDVISIEYSCNLGEDIGGSFTNRDKRIKSITTSVGELTPEFDSDFNEYNLMVPEGTTELSVYTTAVNKNYLVRSIVNGKEYERGAVIPVSDGTHINVKCGDPSWPSMNSYDQEDTVKPVTYRINVFEGTYDFLVDVTGDKCGIELDRESGIYYAGEVVNFSLRYNSNKYNIKEDGVKVYIGGSNKYIVPDKTGDKTYSFTMPCNDVEVKAKCETRPDWPLNVTGNLTGCTMTTDHADGKYLRDEKVTFTLKAESGKRINDLSVMAEEKDSGNTIELEHISQDKYSFTMPGEDVRIYAESEDKTANGLKGYTITTAYGNVNKQLSDASRTSICDLPERAVEFGLSLKIDKSEELTAVRVKDIFGDISTYTDIDISGISVGTRNTALLGKEMAVTVVTKDSLDKTHTYTIRIKTSRSSYDRENPDVVINPKNHGGNDSIPYKKTLMMSGVVVYEADYPTVVFDNKAQRGNIALEITPTYEETPYSIDIRCKYATFIYGNGTYRSGFIYIDPGETLEIPIEVDFSLPSGEKVTKRYLYRITNGRYTSQRFKVLSAKGNPMTPTGFALDGENIPVDSLVFTDGAFSLDLTPGEHRAVSMGGTEEFTVFDDFNRPIETETVIIQTYIPEYNVTLECDERNAVFTVKEVNTGVIYCKKTKDRTLSLPPGKYVAKALDESDHLYSRSTFTVASHDVRITLARPFLLDPEYVADTLDLLEEIQAYDAGDGLMEIYIPDYQDKKIVVKPVIVDNPDDIKMTIRYRQAMSTYDKDMVLQYLVQRNSREHSLYIKYEVYNENDKDDIYTTEDMELYMPPYSGADEEEVLMPPDVRALEIGFGIEDGSYISWQHSSFDEFFKVDTYSTSIPVIEQRGGITDAQLDKAGYKIKYTLRYKENEEDEFLNVWYQPYLEGGFYRTSNDHDCVEFETYRWYGTSRMYISPSIESYSVMDSSMNGWYEVTAWFEDKDGNRSKAGMITVYKDGQPPRFTVSTDVSPDSNEGVYNCEQDAPVYADHPVTVTVNAHDIGLGLHEEPYSFDAGNTWVSGNSITLSEPGVVSLSDIWVRDKFGQVATLAGPKFDSYVYGKSTGYRYTNYSDWWEGEPPAWEEGDNGSRFIYVDMKKPELAVISTFDERTDQMTIKVKASDDISGLADEAYSFDGGETWQTGSEYTVKLGEFRGEQIKVRDKAGNTVMYDPDQVWTRDTFDQEKPKINNVRIVYGEGGGIGVGGRKWYQSAELVVEAEAGGSPVVKYSFDGEKYTSSESKTYKEAVVIEAGTISVTDKAGNIAVYNKTIDLTNIDIVAPLIKGYSFPGMSRTDAVREIRTTINATDELSGGLMYAITPIPIGETVPGYPDGDLDIEWSASTDDDQFMISNVGRKYDKVWLSDGATFHEYGGIHREDNLHLRWGVRLWVKDAAGNTSYQDAIVYGGYIDHDGPDISEVTTEYKNFNDASGIVKVYVAATEPRYSSGLASKAYSFDGGKTWQASNSISIPIGASIPAGQIKVRDKFGNISTYNKVVKTTLQDVITRIKHLDPRKAKDKDFKEIIDLFNQLTDREKSKVYNWQDFLNMMGNRKDQDWDDDYGDIGDPDDGDQGDDHGHDGEDDHGDNGDDHGHNNDDHGEHGDGSGNSDGDSDSGSGNNEGTPSDGNGNGGGRTSDTGKSEGGKANETVSVALSDTSVQDAPDTEAEASSGQSYREAEIDKIGGGLLSHGMVKLWELMLLLIIVLGAYTYGALRKYRRYKEQI